MEQEIRENRGSRGDFRFGVIFGMLSMLLLSMLVFLVLGITGHLQFGSESTSSDMVSLPATIGSGNAELDTAKVVNKLDSLLEDIDSGFYFDFTADQLETGLYKGLFDSLDDTYTVYYTADEYAELQQSSSGTYAGIGVGVQQNEDTGQIVVSFVYSGSPAEAAGIQVDDVIYQVGDTLAETTDISSVAAMIRGEVGTTVDLTIYRPSTDAYLDLTIERANIEVEVVTYEMLEDGVGYIYIAEFEETTFEQFKEALETLQSQGAKGIVLDVRSNPGGLLTSVVDMLDYLLPEGTLVTTRTRYGVANTYSSDASDVEMPFVVLTNGYSASASEIFAAALQDYDWATLVGTTTFGKGIVQSVFAVENGGVKMTVASYFPPNGENIHGVGVAPDIEVEMDEEIDADGPYNGDNQLEKAVEVLQEKMDAQ